MSNSIQPTGRQLVLDAIAHKDTGRIPHDIRYQPTVGKSLVEYYGTEDLEPILDNALEWIGDSLSNDQMRELGLLQSGEYTDRWGIRWHGVGETRGHVKASPLRQPTLRGYQFPHHVEPAVLEQMRAQAAASPGRYRVAKLGALWEQATFLRGMEELLVDLLLHPTFVHDLLDGITDYLLRNLELYRRELLVDCIWLSDDYGSQSGLLMSPTLWRTFIEPRVRLVCQSVHAAGFHFTLHSDGAVSDVIPDIVDMGVDLLNPVQSECVDVGWIKRTFGRDLTIWGGYGTQGSLVFGTPLQVRREVNEICDLLGAGGGFVLAPGITLQSETPLENVVAFIEAAKARQ